MDTLQAWDEALLLTLNGHPDWLRDAAWMLTSKWAAAPVVLLILFRLFRGGVRRRAWLALAAFLVTFAGTDAISSRLMKPGFERLRPSHEKRLSEALTLHHHEDGSVYRVAASVRVLPCRQHLRLGHPRRPDVRRRSLALAVGVGPHRFLDQNLSRRSLSGRHYVWSVVRRRMGRRLPHPLPED